MFPKVILGNCWVIPVKSPPHTHQKKKSGNKTAVAPGCLDKIKDRSEGSQPWEGSIFKPASISQIQDCPGKDVN